MAQAQVALFAPADPAAIWARGTTDDQERVTFALDADQPGICTVQVHQARHGAIVSVATSDDAVQTCTHWLRVTHWKPHCSSGAELGLDMHLPYGVLPF